MELPLYLVRDIETPAHIGETLLNICSKGNPEGSPRDPVTTDPKGEARMSVQDAGYLLTKEAYGD